jgi:hypothetical protein
MDNVVRGSFRDPSGFLFWQDGVLYRQVNERYREDFELFRSSGLYDRLVEKRLLVPHEEAPLELRRSDDGFRVAKPERVPFVSYPYEWCTSQLRDAALLTLEIQELALAHEMTLKDASAFNVQFVGGRPVFIDLLSFEKYREGRPWVPYRQFCQHFLAPLLLARYLGRSPNQWLRVHLDGIPLGLAAAMLPARSYLSPAALLHVHLHAGAERRLADPSREIKTRGVSRLALRGLVDSLRRAVSALAPRPKKSLWSDYYDDCSYTSEDLGEKERIVAELLERVRPADVWDLGANTGRFSVLAGAAGARTVAFDQDADAVERCYRKVATGGAPNVLPLVMDLANPSPALGWASEERLSLVERGPADAVLALALVHHLTIGNNVPVPRFWEFLARVGRHAIIEFVPKSDVQVRGMLAAREDIFDDYTGPGFESSARERFDVVERRALGGSERVLYLLNRRG